MPVLPTLRVIRPDPDHTGRIDAVTRKDDTSGHREVGQGNDLVECEGRNDFNDIAHGISSSGNVEDPDDTQDEGDDAVECFIDTIHNPQDSQES